MCTFNQSPKTAEFQITWHFPTNLYHDLYIQTDQFDSVESENDTFCSFWFYCKHTLFIVGIFFYIFIGV